MGICPYGYSVMTTFFPLTISGRPLFYYIYSPDKKGRVSVRRGETNVVSVLTPFNECRRPIVMSEPIGYLSSNEVDITVPS
jgi:hypothetical protein